MRKNDIFAPSRSKDGLEGAEPRTAPRVKDKNKYPFPPVQDREGPFYMQRLLISLRESILYTIPPYLSIKSGREEAG